MPATINASSSSGIVTTADNSAQLELQTASATRLTINSSGNVGIGTASPAALLNLYSATSSSIYVQGDSTTQIVQQRASTDTSGPVVTVRKARGTTASPSAVTSGDQLGRYIFQAYGGTTNRAIVSIDGYVDTYTSDSNISGYLTFGTSPSGSATPTERMRIDSSGNVGIGTTSPTAKLDVRGAGFFINDTNNYVKLLTDNGAMEISRSSGDAYIDLKNSDSEDFDCRIQSIGTAGDLRLASITSQQFYVAGTERMRITSAGNVGIGTASPAYQLSQLTTSRTRHVLQGATANTGTQGADTTWFDGTTAHSIGFQQSIFGTGGSTFTMNAGNSQAINFVTSNAERMRIDSSGFLMGAGNTSSTNFGLNWGGGQTTTAFNCAQIAGAFMGASGSGGGVDYPYVGYNFYTTTTNGTYKYNGNDFAAAIRYGASGRIDTFTAVSGTATNNITWVTGPYVANSGTSWTNASDARLKNITSEITNAIDKVTQLRAAEFTWKHDDSNKPCVGLIAQDVQKVLPEAVNAGYKIEGDETEYLGVQYTDVIPLLVAAIKEQQTIINDLKASIEILKTKIETLESK